ncbi:MAG: hypothetical protein KME06_14090 [Kastovskya adunca ATA6-11-RM4]|jgi:hypothetical protein|nr:hypothetical protein [Kastovskya adunca ATA6-11-RM4]
MGHSPTIQEMQAKEDKYRQYIQYLEEELRKRADSYEEEQNKTISSYYEENNWDKQNFISGKNVDFLHEKDWSLNNLKTVIERVTKAIFGGNKPPEGVIIEKPEDVGKNVVKMANRELYIAGKTFEVLTGILDTFGNKSSMTFSAYSQVMPIVPGITLFATVVADSYKAREYFNNEQIYQYFYIYEVKYSFKQAASSEALEDIQLYSNLLVSFREKLEDLGNQYAENQLDEDQFEERSDKVQKFIDQYEVKINELSQTGS